MKSFTIICICLMSLNVLLPAAEWQEVGTMSFPVNGAQAVVLDSMIYVLGGYSDSLLAPVNFIQAFDPRDNSWRIAGRMNFKRYGHVTDTWNDSTIVTCGGVWDPMTDPLALEVWNPMNAAVDGSRNEYFDLNFSRVFFSGHIYHDRFYLFGGLTSPAVSDSLYLPYIVAYHLPGNQFNIIEQDIYDQNFLPYHHMTARIDSFVYIIGGVHFNLSNRIMRFDLNRFTLEDVARLNLPRAGGTAVSDGSRIYVIGGYAETGRTKALNSMDIYDIRTGETTAGPVLNHHRKEAVAAIIGRSIYVFGGKDSRDENVPVVEKLDLVTAIENPPSRPVAGFRLYDNFPNPFNPSTTIRFQLPENSDVQLVIYDMSGRRIKSLMNGSRPAGEYRVVWNGTDDIGLPVASGIYLCELTASEHREIRKMILLK